MEESSAQLTKKEKRVLAKQQKKKNRQREQRKSSLTKWISIAIIVGVIGFGIYKFATWVTTPVDGLVDSSVTLEVSEGEWTKGNPDAQLTLIEYSDFQCPACAYSSSMVADVLEQMGDDARLVYRHFPLPSLHSNAFDAALGAEAAGRQDKFFEYHDMLFENQSEWSEEGNPSEKFEQYAQELELDMDRFKQDVESDEVRNAVTADIASGNSLRINSTPTFYLNGQKITNPSSVDEFVSLLQAELPIDAEPQQ